MDFVLSNGVIISTGVSLFITYDTDYSITHEQYAMMIAVARILTALGSHPIIDEQLVIS